MVGEVILLQLSNADSGTDLWADSDDPTRRLIRQVLGAAMTLQSCPTENTGIATDRKRDRTMRKDIGVLLKSR